jgi:WD40 repeat protein/serine/threonine protein kinase/Flp pilus assembly protein TadD
MAHPQEELRALFCEALDRKSPQEQADYLEQACQGRPELRARVEALLRAHVEASGFLQEPTGQLAAAGEEPAATERVGTLIGPYKLLQQIGEGGFGIVYMAEQTQPVQRKVALKIIKPGMDSRQVIARFEAERQALALMDHPHIAKVLDADTTASGRPYFVMELVKGVPITKYCDEHRLTPRERLELFIPVCQAVQHAHQKGIIHRDLKPSNVLIALYDGKPVPKVIDFGIAKAMGPKLTERTLFTEFGQVVGTLEYMSPEQAELNQLDIDTRSDIYSLGVLLYELLTGTTPLERKRLQKAALLEVLRLIREEEPPRPSTRLSTTEELPAIAANRGLEPKKLSGLVRGELDWIVMKALEKDRNRRYETANGLALDVQRYLRDEPVLACPPSAVYQLRKFARRYRMALVVTAVVALALGLTMLALIWGIFRVREEQKETDKQRQNAEVALEKEKLATRRLNNSIEALGIQQQRTRLALDRERQTTYAHRLGLAYHEWQAGNLATAGQLLNGCPQESRQWEWHYLRYLCHTDLLLITPPFGEIAGVVFSPDGRRLAAVGSVADAKLYDALTGEEILTLRGHTAGIHSVAFSPDGKYLATASQDKTIKMWDAATGQERLTLRGHTGVVYAVAFSPDGGRLASAGGDRSVRLWDAATGQEVAQLVGHAAEVRGLAFSPDGSRLATACMDRNVRIWNVASQQLLQIRPHTTAVISVAFGPDGKRFAAGSLGGTVKIWDAAAGREVLHIAGNGGGIHALAYSPDSRHLATAGADRIIKFWDTQLGQEVLSLRGHTQPILSLAFGSMDGAPILASGGRDRAVRIWDATAVQSSLTAPDGRPRGPMALSPNGQYLALASVRMVQLWHLLSGQVAATLQGHTLAVRCVAFSPDGSRLATAGLDRAVKVWETASGKETLTIPTSTTTPSGLAFSPDGKCLALADAATQRAGQAGKVKIWDAATGTELLTLSGPSAGITAVAFSPNGSQLATASYDGTVTIWEAATGKELRTLRRQGHPVFAVAFSADGERLATAGGVSRLTGEVVVWDTATGQGTQRLGGQLDAVYGLAFLSRRRFVSTGMDGTVRVWDLDSNQEVLKLSGHTGEVRSVAYSAETQCLATAGAEVKLWYGSDFHVSRLLHARPANWQLYLRRGDAYAEQGRHAQAFADYSRALELRPDDWQLWVKRARAYQGQREYDRALTDICRALELRPDNWRLWNYRGSIHRSLGQLPEALAAFSQALAQKGDALEVWHDRAQVYADLGRWDEAVADYSKALEIRPTDTRSLAGRSQVYLERGQWDKADADLARALELQPALLIAWQVRAVLRLAQRDRAGYRQTCASILERYGKTEQPSTAWTVAWICALAPGATAEPDRLVQLAETSVYFDSSYIDPDLRYNYARARGAALLRAGLYGAAQEQLNEAAQMRKWDTPTTWLLLAIAHHHLGQPEEARQWLGKAVQWVEESMQQAPERRAIPTFSWHRVGWAERQTFQLLRREAEELIQGATGFEVTK